MREEAQNNRDLFCAGSGGGSKEQSMVTYFPVPTVRSIFSHLEQLLANLHKVRIVTPKTKKAKRIDKNFSRDIISLREFPQAYVCYEFFVPICASITAKTLCLTVIKYGRIKGNHNGKRRMVPWNTELSVDVSVLQGMFVHFVGKETCL